MCKVDVIIFYCISLVLTENMVGNLHMFYSLEILYVTNFTTMNEKITLLCKNIVLSHGKQNFYSSSKIQMLQFIIQVSHKN